MSCICQQCNLPYNIDLVIPDELWKEISPQPIKGFKGGGLLCPSCIIKKIEQITIDSDCWYLVKEEDE